MTNQKVEGGIERQHDMTFAVVRGSQIDDTGIYV